MEVARLPSPARTVTTLPAAVATVHTAVAIPVLALGMALTIWHEVAHLLHNERIVVLRKAHLKVMHLPQHRIMST